MTLANSSMKRPAASGWFFVDLNKEIKELYTDLKILYLEKPLYVRQFLAPSGPSKRATDKISVVEPELRAEETKY